MDVLERERAVNKTGINSATRYCHSPECHVNSRMGQLKVSVQQMLVLCSVDEIISTITRFNYVERLGADNQEDITGKVLNGIEYDAIDNVEGENTIIPIAPIFTVTTTTSTDSTNTSTTTTTTATTTTTIEKADVGDNTFDYGQPADYVDRVGITIH
ncbi:hypothetical protein KIN20_019987 [Parelaphostrongylus tenuis]|uniref:Uncharacterized protein n=1 Tax=Parelaphostrongylus tenuis TaxID=148309 RepID=A0AAD5N5H0_PARTN|nr:hypothetical protein KIN20_019987 [Parelaphostrongylus tenuis]